MPPRPETYRSAVNEFAMRELVWAPTSAIELTDLGPHSHGSISKALRKMRDRGLLTMQPMITETRPRVVRRKVYTLTETGRALARQWGITDDQ